MRLYLRRLVLPSYPADRVGAARRTSIAPGPSRVTPITLRGGGPTLTPTGGVRRGPCKRYVEYMEATHPEETADGELRAVLYDVTDSDVLDSCEIELMHRQAEDRGGAEVARGRGGRRATISGAGEAGIPVTPSVLRAASGPLGVLAVAALVYVVAELAGAEGY